MTRRFKTKQEFNNEYGPDWKDKRSLPWHPKREVLYGLEWAETGNYLKPYPNLIGHIHGLKVTPEMLTTAPHPYEGRDIVIEISSEKESVAAQKKVLALGYLWNGGYSDVRDRYGSTDLCISGGKLFRNPDSEDYRTHLVLSFTQFMEGEVPKTEDQYVNEFWQEWKKTNDDRVTATRITMMGGEGKIKPDAYIHEGELYIWSGNKEMPANVNKAWMYNLMSEEDFKAKHTPQLKFKGWEVSVDGDNIRVNCPGHLGKKFPKDVIKNFVRFADSTGGQNPTASLDEIYDFIHTHKKELGL